MDHRRVLVPTIALISQYAARLGADRVGGSRRRSPVRNGRGVAAASSLLRGGE